MLRTKVTELLDSNKVTYRLLEHARPVFTCEEAAAERKVPLSEMVKCILLVDKKKKYALACIPADRQLDPNKVRNFLDGYARLSFAAKDEIAQTTGYGMGALPPLLLKTRVPLLFDQSLQLLEKCNISSGDPRAGIELAARDLLKLCQPWFGNIMK